MEEETKKHPGGRPRLWPEGTELAELRLRVPRAVAKLLDELVKGERAARAKGQQHTRSSVVAAAVLDRAAARVQ